MIRQLTRQEIDEIFLERGAKSLITLNYKVEKGAEVVSDREKEQLEIPLDGNVTREKKKATYEMSLSSDTYVREWFGYLALDHTPDAINQTRIKNGLPILFNHDRNLLVGKWENMNLKNGKMYGTPRYSQSAFAQEKRQDVDDDILTETSISFEPDEMWLDHEKDGICFYRATKWTPDEASLVTVPADTTVGKNRSKNLGADPNINNRKDTDMADEPKVVVLSENEIRAAAQNEAFTRATEINALTDLYESKGLDLKAERAKAFSDPNYTVSKYKDEILRRMTEKQEATKATTDLGLSDKEQKEYSFVRAINQIMDGTFLTKGGIEAEAHKALIGRGMQPQSKNSFLVPQEGQRKLPSKRTLNTTSASGGGFLVDDKLMPESFIPLRRNNMVTPSLGIQVLNNLSGNVLVPRQTSASTAYWFSGTGGTITASDPAFGQIALTPKYLGAMTGISLSLLTQGTPDVENLVVNDLDRVLAIEKDRVVFHGLGASNEPIGIANVSGIGTVSGASYTWAAAVEHETDLMTSNSLVGNPVFVTNPTIYGILKTRVKVSGYPVYLSEDGKYLNGYPIFVTNQVASGFLFFGDFSSSVIGYWNQLEIAVNPWASTQFSDGSVLIRAMEAMDHNVRYVGGYSVATSVS